MKKYILVMFPLLVFAMNSQAGDDDYPTIDTVRFVIECMADIGEQNEENLYTCTCRYDVVAGMMPFERYEQATFFKRYSRMPGKRGGLVRDNKEADELVSELDEAYEVSRQKCPTVKHVPSIKRDKETE